VRREAPVPPPAPKDAAAAATARITTSQLTCTSWHGSCRRSCRRSWLRSWLRSWRGSHFADAFHARVAPGIDTMRLHSAHVEQTTPRRRYSPPLRMDSPAPINFQAHTGRIAQAYGAKSPAMRGVANVGAPNPNQPGKATIGPNGVIQPPFPVTRDPNGRGAASDVRQDRVTLQDRPNGATASPQPIEQLVAGQVDSPISRGQGFDEPAARTASARPATAAGAYAMYTRSADRVEVATAVAVGRTLDARG
jgi:hypothetical protein